MIDWTKPIATKSRNPAVLIGRLPHPHDGTPMVVRVFYEGKWTVETYSEAGVYHDRPCGWDLMNVEHEVRSTWLGKTLTRSWPTVQ